MAKPMEIPYAPFTYLQSKTLLRALAAAYPCAGLSVIGASVTKRGIFALSLGDGEENVLFLSGLCADESAMPLLLYRFFARLCESYESDGTLAGVKIRRTLRGRKITVVPCLVPDAFEIRRFGAIGAGCYAGLVSRAAGEDFKNWRANARGVNVAHNFDCQFRSVLLNTSVPEEKRRPSPFAYAGPAPESEAETAALVRLCARSAFRHCVVLSEFGRRVFWNAPEATRSGGTQAHAVPITAKILAAAGNYTLSQKENAIKHGAFPLWFAQTHGTPAYEIAPGKYPRVSSAAEFDALYTEIEEMLVLAAIV